MKINSKTAAVLLAAVMTLSTACGSSGSDNPSSSAENQSQAQTDANASVEQNQPENENVSQQENTGDSTPQSGGNAISLDVVDSAVDEQLRGMTALEASVLMGNGINLGNTMEAYAHKRYVEGGDPTTFETSWGQPVTKKEMIDGMKAAGFDTIRIPIAWTNGMNFETGDYTIDERLFNRVDEIVSWALADDMYVIINDHWDGSWWGMFGSADPATREKAMEMYKAMWSQICERYKDCSYRLIFESANEELGDRLNDTDIAADSGSLSKKECYEKTYEINSEFVKLVRSTGGKNEDRFLLIAGYNTDITNTCKDDYKMPEDTAKDKLFISVHYYTPWDYCGTDAVNQWGSPKNYEEQNKLLGMMQKFTDGGYGVIIGEYAVMSSKSAQKPDSDLFYTNFLNNCDYYNYVPVLWDCNDLYKRAKCEISDELYADLYLSRSYAKQSELYSEEQIRENAKNALDAAAAAAEEHQMEGISLPASDDMAIAWIMYQSADFAVAYSVGDTYDPTNMSEGIIAENVQVTGEGTYTVSLDMSSLKAKGVAFSALGISNGETFFPGYIANIDSVKINGEEVELTGMGYTCSDNKICTRVNLYNQWVKQVPDDVRCLTFDDMSPTILEVSDKKLIKTISVTFSFIAPGGADEPILP